MNWCDPLERLDFYKNLTVDYEIHPVRGVETQTFVRDWKHPLSLDAQSAFGQLEAQARLIRGFQ